MRRASPTPGKKVSIKIRREDYDLLRSLGNATGKSVSCLVGTAIEEFINLKVDLMRIDHELSKHGCQTRKQLVAQFLKLVENQKK